MLTPVYSRWSETQTHCSINLGTQKVDGRWLCWLHRGTRCQFRKCGNRQLAGSKYCGKHRKVQKVNDGPNLTLTDPVVVIMGVLRRRFPELYL
jgi:hypothetical protein